MKTLSHIIIAPGEVKLNDKVISTAGPGILYREFVGDYPKFFKMDALCKLGFIGAELLLRDVTPEEKENATIILFNRNGSLITDRNYSKTITDDNYFPSPSLFVYTLANIVTGEIAIRHKIYGETSFYVLAKPDTALMETVAADAYLTSSPTFILTGWVDYNDENNYLADLKLVTK